MNDDLTTSAQQRSSPAANGLVQPVRRIVEYVFWGYMSWLIWFWGAGVVLWIASMIAIPRLGELEVSTWEFLGLGWTRWVLFAAGCVLAYTSFPMLVAQGLTRRRVAQGSVAGIAVLAAVGAVIVTVVSLAEAAVFAWSDVAHTLSDQHLFDDVGQFWWVAVEAFLVYGVYALSGWFIALCFYRWGTVIGLASIVGGLVPIAVVEAALSSSVLPENVDWLYLDTHVGVHLLVALAAGAAIATLTATLMRATPLRARPR